MPWQRPDPTIHVDSIVDTYLFLVNKMPRYQFRTCCSFIRIFVISRRQIDVSCVSHSRVDRLSNGLQLRTEQSPVTAQAHVFKSSCIGFEEICGPRPGRHGQWVWYTACTDYLSNVFSFCDVSQRRVTRVMTMPWRRQTPVTHGDATNRYIAGLCKIGSFRDGPLETVKNLRFHLKQQNGEKLVVKAWGWGRNV